MFTHNYIHLRAVRRGIKITEKYLNDQKDISQLDITKTDIKGRNIFHLGVQSTELLEFLLEKFEKVGLGRIRPSNPLSDCSTFQKEISIFRRQGNGFEKRAKDHNYHKSEVCHEVQNSS